MAVKTKIAFNKFLNAMKKLSEDANDREICKRFEILMNSSKDDLDLDSVNMLLQGPIEFEPTIIPDPYTPFIRHFIYMVKRFEKTNQYRYSEVDIHGIKQEAQKKEQSVAEDPRPAPKKNNPVKKAQKRKK